MGVWIFMLIMDLLLPFTMIGFGRYFMKKEYRRNYLWCSTYSFNWVYSPNRNSIKKEF